MTTPVDEYLPHFQKKGKTHSKYAVKALCSALLCLPDVQVVGTFGQLDNTDGDTTTPNIILGTNNLYSVQKFATFLRQNHDKIARYGRPMATRVATTHTFINATPNFQQILGRLESTWCNNIGNSLTVYVLPINWTEPSKQSQLKKLFRTTVPKSFWDDLHKTARLVT